MVCEKKVIHTMKFKRSKFQMYFLQQAKCFTKWFDINWVIKLYYKRLLGHFFKYRTLILHVVSKLAF